MAVIAIIGIVAIIAILFINKKTEAYTSFIFNEQKKVGIY